ncbi:reverse transcriptase domain-containing protein [Tanacetum coccineum]|uniref:Reverse transcriptase domain-containing protein n=1 Tax=Tanacetum coccineum TaxID=301880 RepID=A0ABQ4YAG5_9ASTR
MSLELADRSIQYPRGIVENVLIKVDKFVNLIDFVILDMPKDSRVVIILGRPFLATARAKIDVFNKNDNTKGLEKSIEQSNLKSYECEAADGSDSIRRIKAVNTPYRVEQKMAEPNKVKREQLYSASANEIDEKKPELKILPQHL